MGEAFERASLSPHLAILRDPANTLTLADVMSPERAVQFVPNRAACPSFGYAKDAIWVRFSIRSESVRPLELVTELANARGDWLEWHVVSGGRAEAVVLAGNRRTGQRSMNRAPMPALPLALGPGEEKTVYLRVETETSVILPLTLYSPFGYMHQAMKRNAWNYGHVGLSLALVLISLSMALVLRSRLFAFHAGLVLFYLVHVWIYSGYYVWMEWPAGGYMARQGMLGAGGLALVFLLAHVREFFGAEMLTSRLYFFIQLMTWVMLGCVLLTLVLPYWVGVWLVNLVWIAVNGISAGTSIWQYAVRKRNYWRFNLLAWGISACMLSLVILELSGVVPTVLNPEEVLRNLLLVIAILLLVAMFDRLQLLARRDLLAREADRSLAEARFQTLRYQINPHFLFNTLNSIEALSREQPERIPELVGRLATFLRTTLDVRRDALTPFSREIESVQAYLGIESVRFEERLAVEFSLDPAAGAVRVPELILQPLVENAIKHGMKTSPAPLRIRIASRLEGAWLEVKVENSGLWATGEPGGRGAAGIGLANLKDRLTHLYDRRHGFTVEARDGWVTATLRLPVTREAGA